MKKIFSLVLAVSLIVTFCLGNIMAEETSVVEEETALQEKATTLEETTIMEETTISEENVGWADVNTDNFSTQQNKVLSLLKELPTSDHENFMESIQVLYSEYERLSETDQAGSPESVNKRYNEALSQAGDMNHCDNNTKVMVMSDNLPWYIKVVVEKKSTELLQNAWNDYLEKLYIGDDSENEDDDRNDDSNNIEDDYGDEDSNESDEEDDYGDEDFNESDGEDDYGDEDFNESDEQDEYYYDDDNEENNELVDEYYYDFPGVINEHFSEYTLLGYGRDESNSSTVATVYEISLYDTLRDEEYQLSENEKVMVILPYEKEYLGYWLDVIHLTDDSSIEFVNTLLYSKNAFEKVKYDYQENMYDDDDEESDEQEYDDNESDDEDINDDNWEEEENNKIDVDNYGVAFELNNFSQYGVVLSYPVSKACSGGGKVEDDVKNVSPKTGYSLLRVYFIDVMAICAIVCVLIYRRKRLKGEDR